MDKKYDACVFIGRFQPFHKGHMHVLKEAAKLSEQLIIMIGSCQGDRTLRNPLTGRERERAIAMCIAFSPELKEVYQKDVHIVQMKDCETDEQWQFNLRMEVERIVLKSGSAKNKEICLIGHDKDASSYYLKLFPQWHMHDTGEANVINATDIRRAFWRDDLTMANSAVDPIVSLMFQESMNFKPLQAKYLQGETDETN